MDLFQLRSVHNDVSFVDAVLDEDFVRRSISSWIALAEAEGGRSGPAIRRR